MTQFLVEHRFFIISEETLGSQILGSGVNAMFFPHESWLCAYVKSITESQLFTEPFLLGHATLYNKFSVGWGNEPF